MTPLERLVKRLYGKGEICVICVASVELYALGGSDEPVGSELLCR